MFHTKRETEANYSSIFIDGKTLRIPIDHTKPITELRWPEFYDISMGTKCSGNCIYYCYASALKTGIHYKNLAKKINQFFGQMTDNQRPLQVACGGQAESMENPECWEALEAFRNLNIIPNITTNGMFVNDKTIEKIEKYCLGAAVTCHDHLEKFWRRAIELLHKSKIRLNIHVIISDKESIHKFINLYKEYSKKIEYFVLLPRMNVGHAAKYPKKIDYIEFESTIDQIYKEGKLAFGANFYPWLLKKQKKYKIQLYSPEIFSKYLLLNDKLELFNNSFEMKPVPYNKLGCELGHARTEFVI